MNSETTRSSILYAVLKLQTLVEVVDSVGHAQKVKINGIEGYIPVFKTEEEAKKEACSGKYQIIVVGMPTL